MIHDGAAPVDDGTLAAKADDDGIIGECRARMKISLDADGENRTNGLDDLSFIKGDQWDQTIKAQRIAERRPCLTINKLPTFLHQVTNSQRQNVPSIKVHAIADADTKVADVVQGLIRHVEYSSGADVCYDTAVNSAAAIGFGYFRLVTDYTRDDSFDQEIQFRRIRNPFTVYMDPAHINVDGSDMQWCILSAKMPRTEFKVEHPDADPCDMGFDTGTGDGEWVTDQDVRIAEYYRLHREAAEVVQLSNGESGFKDKLVALPQGVTVVKTRMSTRTTVQWFKLTAREVLDRADIPCRWIPVFPVFGDEIDIDGKVYRNGLVRHAKDPARLYNYWITNATEEVALRPKTPYIGAEGQFEGHEAEWAAANTTSFAYLEYKPKSLGGNLAPPPQRQAMADFPVGVMQMAAHASDDIKATTGIFDASLGAKSNETSGIAIQRRDRQGETANYHFIDNLNITLRHVGRCILDMVPKVYDAPRLASIMGEDGKVTSVPVNMPMPGGPKVDPKTGAIQTVLNDLTVGDYMATISVGPSYDTMRQEAVDGMVQVAQSWPKLMDIAGDKVIRSMDWPMADEIADRIEKTMPPELRDSVNPDDPNAPPPGPPPIPPEVQQQLQHYESALSDAMKQLDEAKTGMQKAQLEADTKIEVAKIGAASINDAAEIKGMVELLLERMQPPPQLAADVSDAMAHRDSTPSAPEPVDNTPAMLAQLIKALHPPKTKSMALQGPSGAIYHGQIVEQPMQDAGPMPPEPAPQPDPGATQ